MNGGVEGRGRGRLTLGEGRTHPLAPTPLTHITVILLTPCCCPALHSEGYDPVRLLPFPLLPPPLPPCSRSLLCVYQLHSAAINSLVVHDSFCVTGSDDKVLRVWPLDFSDYLLEVRGGGRGREKNREGQARGRGRSGADGSRGWMGCRY